MYLKQGNKAGRRYVSAALLFAVAIAAITGVVLSRTSASPDGNQDSNAAGDPPAASSDNSPEATVKGILSNLPCRDIGYMYDDMYFYDHMFGVNCYDDDGDVTIIRAYESPDSVSYVLRDWQPLINSSRLLITGPNWFAVGTQSMLTQIKESVPGASQVTGTVPEGPNLTPDSERELETKCVSFISGALVLRSLDPQQYNGQLDQMNEAYPGIGDLVDSQLSEEDIAELRSLDSISDDYRFESYLSRFGSTVKELCGAQNSDGGN